MEVHFVHRNDVGNLAVVGIMMIEGMANAAFNKTTMPTQEGASVKADTAVDPSALLPAQRNYFQYAGSLTTPPCTVTVNRILLRDPLQVAKADIEAFARIYPMNARPAQKANRRFILQP